jgi:hypothetical protein
VGSRYRAHLDLRATLFPILWICGLGGVAMVLAGCANLPRPLAWAELAVGAGLLAVTLGIWNAREWARWTAGILAAADVARLAWDFFGSEIRHSWLAYPFAILPLGWLAFVAAYALRPAAKARFQEAREAIARARSA